MLEMEAHTSSHVSNHWTLSNTDNKRRLAILLAEFCTDPLGMFPGRSP